MKRIKGLKLPAGSNVLGAVEKENIVGEGKTIDQSIHDWIRKILPKKDNKN